MKSFWKAALGVGGIAAIGAFVFWGLYKEWLTLDIFSQMSAEQTFEIMKIFLWLTFASLLVMAITYLLSRGNGNRLKTNSEHVFELHKAWKGVNEIDCDRLIGPDVTNAARALTITASSWLNGVVDKNIIIQNHFEDFELLYKKLMSCQKTVPGFQKRNLKCPDFVSSEMKRAYSEMQTYTNGDQK